MEAKGGSAGFDFEGTYDKVEPLRHIVYTLDDGRMTKIDFREEGNPNLIAETFDADP